MPETGQPQGQQFYCELFIKGTQYNPKNINYLIIREWIFNIIPTIEIQFLDDGYLTEVTPLEDGEDIIVTIAKDEDADEVLELTFALDDYEVGILGDNRKSLVTFTGHLKMDDLFRVKSRHLSKRNSSAVLETIASENGIPFKNPHNVTPADNMIWYQNGISNFDFIRHVLKRVYVPNDTCFFYANTNNEFVFTSLLSEMNKQERLTCKYNVNKFEWNIIDDKDPDNTIWFNSYSIVNNSAFFNKLGGYGVSYSYYNLKGNKQETNISDITMFSDLSFRNKSCAGCPTKYRWGGDLIEPNVYGGTYFESRVRNRFLRDNFFAFSLVLNVNAINKINLLDTVDVAIPSLFADDDSNEVMSGEYLVAGIQHEISNNGIYRKKISVGRNGMNKSPDLTGEYQVEEKSA